MNQSRRNLIGMGTAVQVEAFAPGTDPPTGGIELVMEAFADDNGVELIRLNSDHVTKYMDEIPVLLRQSADAIERALEERRRKTDERIADEEREAIQHEDGRRSSLAETEAEKPPAIVHLGKRATKAGK
jgi:hypothetical protein